MTVPFTPEQEALILQLANYNGTSAEDWVRQAALRLVEEDEHFQADIRAAIEQADRGQLISHEEVKARIDRSFHNR
jgi:predicted transcriptional regulator